MLFMITSQTAADRSTGPSDPLHPPPDAARVLRVSLSWLAKARLTGDGPRFVKIGRSVRYPESFLREYIKIRTRSSTSER
jgi:predicted DNA-binding transcriptional regulator AlpA